MSEQRFEVCFPRFGNVEVKIGDKCWENKVPIDSTSEQLEWMLSLAIICDEVPDLDADRDGRGELLALET